MPHRAKPKDRDVRTYLLLIAALLSISGCAEKEFRVGHYTVEHMGWNAGPSTTHETRLQDRKSTRLNSSHS